MTNDAGPGLSQIGQIAINVADVERATAFYRDALGLKHLFSVAPKMAFFDCGGVRLMLSLPDKPEFDHPSSILYFRVADIRASHDVLVGRGVRFEAPLQLTARMESYDLWMGFFRDSEGNLLALMCEQAR